MRYDKTPLWQWPRVVIASMWRNDHDRHLNDRVRNLLWKSWPNLRWVWVVGDSSDGTEQDLRNIIDKAEPIHQGKITLVRYDTNIPGTDPHSRMLRGSATFNRAFEEIIPEDHYVIWHESDLFSPDDLVERMLEHGTMTMAGWPILTLPDGRVCFYDTWGYRANGTKFTNFIPYHEVYTTNGIFEVETAGSVLMVPAKEVAPPNGIRAVDMGVVDLCRGLRDRGYSIYVDPDLIIVQPTDLWSPADGYETSR